MKISKYNIVGILIIALTLFMSVGYALYNQTLNLNGNITLVKVGKIEIKSATIVNSECSNIANYTNPTINDLNLSFTLTGNAQTFTATYLVEIENNSYSDYAYTAFSFDTNLSNTNISTEIIDTTTGETIEPGEVISAGETKNLKVKLTITTDSTNAEVTINGNASFTTDNTGKMIASITPNSGNLQGNNTLACFDLTVANTYTYNRTFNLLSSNTNLTITNSKGNINPTFQVGANATETYKVCTKVTDGSIFTTDEITTSIILKSNGISNITVGELTLAVDKDLIASDKEIPTVGNVIIAIPEQNTVEGSANITWDRIDTGGSSIKNYYIILYNSDTSTSTNYETGSSVTSYTVTGLSEGNYYAKVYGVDEAGNIGQSSCDSATTSNGYCSMSNTTNLKWKYTITFSLTNLRQSSSSSNTDSAIIYQSYSTTLRASGLYSLPSSITVTMGGNTLTSGSDYTYNSSSGAVVINKITGDVTITATGTASCLVKGTKIKLANGKTKNVEDITYNDLLLVWNYETGSYTYEYPIWIEKSKTTKVYQKTTLSDGTTLKTVDKHGVFSKDANMFVSVSDKDNFKIGTSVAKLDDNNKLTYVKVTNIENIYEEVEYYHVVSTRYYNIIANNILTTDGNVILSNLYEFGDKINWINRNYNELSLYDYSLFSDIMPYYMFKGLRVEEGKVLSNYLDYNTFKDYLLKNQLNDTMLLKPNVNNSSNRLWMVTTSDDQVIKQEDYLYEENSYYTLKEPINKDNFKYWINTSDGKIYYPNDTLKVIHGMHFIARYN